MNGSIKIVSNFRRGAIITLQILLLLNIFAFSEDNNITKNNIDLMLLIDHSESMIISDRSSQRTKAIDFCVKFLNRYSTESNNHRIGIVNFATNPVLALPLISIKDVDTKNLVQVRDIRFTDFQSALDLVYKEFRNKGSFNMDHNPQIILITDGRLIGSKEEFTKHQGDEFIIKKLRERLVAGIGDNIVELKERGCAVNIIIFGGSEEDKEEDKKVWKNFSISTNGLFYAFKEIADAEALENKCQKILSKVLNLYHIQIHSPKRTQFGINPIFIKAHILIEKGIVIDPSIILRAEVTRPDEIIDTLNLTGNKEGLYILDYLEKPEIGEYAIQFKVLDDGNILSKLNRELKIDKKKVSGPRKFLLILLCIMIILFGISVIKLNLRSNLYKRKRLELKKILESPDVNEGFFKSVENKFNESVSDKGETDEILDETADMVIKTGERGSSVFCMGWRNKYLQEDEDGEEAKIKKYLKKKNTILKQGIGSGISFNLLLMAIESNEKNILIRLYNYLRIGIDLEVLRYAREFLESSDCDRVISISRKILEDRGILKDIDEETLKLKQKEVKAICNIFYQLLDINKINIRSQLKTILENMRGINRNILYMDFIYGIYESIYNSLEPKFWEGYKPFIISKNLTHDGILESKLPDYLRELAMSLLNLEKKSVFPISKLKKSLNILKKVNKNANLPEKNVIEILINRWENAIKDTFIGSDGKFNDELKPKIKINMITKNIPLNSSNYEKRYNKRMPVYFELINEGKGILRKLEIHIFAEGISVTDKKEKGILIDNKGKLTRLNEGLIYYFDIQLQKQGRKKINLTFEIEFDDIQKANNRLILRGSKLEIFKIKPFYQIDNQFVIERDHTLKEVKTILEDKEEMRVINIYGQPKIGKTSVLLKLLKERDSKYIFAYNNFHVNHIDADYKSFHNEIKKNILNSIKSQYTLNLEESTFIRDSNRKSFMMFIENILDQLEKNMKIILIIDDFDLFFRSVKLEEHKYQINSSLKEIIESNDRIILIFSGTCCINEYKLYPQLKPLSLFFDDHSTEILLNLPRLEDIERRFIIDELYYHFNEIALRKIVKVTNGNPHYLNLLLDSMHRLYSKDKLDYITRTEVNGLINNEIEDSEIDSFWERLSYEEKLILLALNDVARWEQSATLSEIALSLKQYSDSIELELDKSDIQNLLNIVEYMVKKEIINKKYGRYSINIELLNKKIKKHKDKFEKTLRR